MVDHIANQVEADAYVIALFARRGATRYEQLTTIKQRLCLLCCQHAEICMPSLPA